MIVGVCLSGCGDERQRGAWSVPERLLPFAPRESLFIYPIVALHEVAVGASGDAVVTWEQCVIIRVICWEPALYARRLEPAGGWTEASRLELLASQFDLFPFTSRMSADGEALLLWQAPTAPGDPPLRSARSGRGSGWVSLDPLGPASSRRVPAVDFGADGTAVAVWSSPDGAVLASRRERGGGWSAPLEISSRREPGTPDAKVAALEDGHAIAVWGTYGQVLASRFDPRGGWRDPVPLSAAGAEVNQPVAAQAAGGAVIVAWTQRGAFGDSLWSSRLDTTGWTPPELAETLGTPVSRFALAANASGHAMLAWADDSSDLWAARSRRAGHWEAAESLQLGWDGARLAGNSQDVSIALDRHGRALAVFRQDGVRANRFVPGMGWLGAERIDLPDIGSAPSLGMDDRGHALAAWTQIDGLWAARFDPDAVRPED